MPCSSLRGLRFLNSRARDVRSLVLRDVRARHPLAVEEPESFLIAGIAVRRPGPLGEIAGAAAGMSPSPPPQTLRPFRAACPAGFHVRLKSSVMIRPLLPLPFTFGRSTPSSRGSADTEVLACALPKASSSTGAREAELSRVLARMAAGVGRGGSFAVPLPEMRCRCLRRVRVAPRHCRPPALPAPAASEDEHERAFRNLVADLDLDLLFHPA